MPTPNSAVQWKEFWDSQRDEVETSPKTWLRSAIMHCPTWTSRQLIVYLNRSCDLIMARGTGQAKTNNTAKSSAWTDFVDIPLTGVEYGAIYNAYPTTDIVDVNLVRLLEKGYRVSFSYNTGNDAFICSVTCKDEGSVNSGQTYNSFAGSWFEALQVALYKHYVVANENWKGAGGAATRPKFG